MPPLTSLKPWTKQPFKPCLQRLDPTDDHPQCSKYFAGSDVRLRRTYYYIAHEIERAPPIAKERQAPFCSLDQHHGNSLQHADFLTAVSGRSQRYPGLQPVKPCRCPQSHLDPAVSSTGMAFGLDVHSQRVVHKRPVLAVVDNLVSGGQH